MLSWVGKVVPLQPPQSPIKISEEKPTAPRPAKSKLSSQTAKKNQDGTKPKSPKATKAKKTEESTSSSAGGPKRVFALIAESFTPPRPGTGESKQENVPVITRSDSMSSINKEQGVLGRIVDIIEIVETVVPLPQPPANEEPDEPEETEVYDADELPDAEPMPHISAIEVESEEEVEEEEEEDPTKPFPQRVIRKELRKIKKTFESMVPQPEIYIRADGKVQKRKKKKEEKPPADPEKLVGWIVQEVERILPQPVGKDGDEVQNRGR